MRFKLPLLLLIPALAGPLNGQGSRLPKEAWREFKAIVVLDNGRLKPLDSFARNTLLELSGRKNVAKRPAVEWLADVFFMPEGTPLDRIFRIEHPEAVEALGLVPQERMRYTYAELSPVLGNLQRFAGAASRADEKKRTPLETEFLRAFHKVRTYLELRGGLPAVVPPFPGMEGEWRRPGPAIEESPHDPSFAALTGPLGAMAKAYSTGDAAGFETSSAQFNAAVRARAGASLPASKIALEIYYNGLAPFFWAKLLYLAGFLAALFSLLRLQTLFRRTSLTLLTAGLLIHGTGIALRMIISGRPPITNLYETFLFVGLTGALLGVVLEAFNKRGLGAAVAGLSGLALLLVSDRYAVDGDTLGVLVAVLDSNFWLSTHVLTISLGYAGCCVAGLLGHLYVLQSLFPSVHREELHKTQKMIFGVLGFGLVFSFLGTILGGIWADQSWGRFWGWDPKENGALMIVLWCAILFHARLARLAGPLGFAVGSILGIGVVMLAWFGINLLGVGLHSYGFTSGIQKGLMAFFIGEGLFLALTVPFVKRPASAQG